MARPHVPGISFVRSLGGIHEYKLVKNGLRILLCPDRAVPVAGCMVTYHVGSKNEATGYTGATHLLEHLMFKGSKNFNPESNTAIDELMETRGGMINATTWYDRTNYYEVVPRDALTLAIEIEADRMRHARIKESDRQSEMPVVRNEFERGENIPMYALEKEIWAAAFVAHPYHHSTIGWRSDIEKVSIERLQQFYDDFYWPDNATVSVAGDFDEAEVLKVIKKEFGKHPRKPSPYPQMYTEEPEQQGQRRVKVKRAGTNMVAIAYKIPEALHTDIPALLVLSSILSEDKTSRLHRALVDGGLATEVLSSCEQFADPSLFTAGAVLTPKTSHEAAEKAIVNTLMSVAEGGVSAEQVKRAKAAARRHLAERRDGPYAFLSALNEEIATGDWTRFVSLLNSIEKVSAAEVKRVAKTYFNEDRSTVGWFVNTAV